MEGLEKLTPEQCQIIEDNMTLVYSAVNKKYGFLDQDKIEELYSVGMLGLVEAIHRDNYDPEKGELSTYLYSYIIGYTLRYFGKNKKHDSTLSLNYTYGADIDGEEFELIDTVDSDSYYGYHDDYKMGQEAYETFKEYEQKFLDGMKDKKSVRQYKLKFRDGCTYEQIADMYNVSRQNIHHKVNRIKDKLVKSFQEDVDIAYELVYDRTN